MGNAIPLVNGCKGCSRCKRVLPVSEFYPRSDGPHRLYSQCKSCVSAKNKRWWASTDQERVREIYRKQATKKRQSGQYRVRARITHGIYMSLRGEKAGKSAYSLLPYTRAELVAHLERQFLRGMTWGNYGDWHIDHIVPLSSFTITGPDDPELCRAWALPNLRPLWAADNIRKKDKRETLL